MLGACDQAAGIPILFATRLAGCSGLMGGALVLSIPMLVGNFGRNRSGLWPTHSPPHPAAALS
jgi:hypothetical protein